MPRRVQYLARAPDACGLLELVMRFWGEMHQQVCIGSASFWSAPARPVTFSPLFPYAATSVLRRFGTAMCQKRRSSAALQNAAALFGNRNHALVCKVHDTLQTMHPLEGLVKFFRRQSRGWIFLQALSLVGAIGFFDYFTGYEVTVFPFYSI